MGECPMHTKRRLTMRSTAKSRAETAVRENERLDLERKRRDLAFMRNPLDWPKWPLLPLKLRDGSGHEVRFCGLLFADEKPVVYFGNVYALPKADGQTWRDVLSEFEFTEYETFEDLVAEYTID
jgi:hypothetical protein